MSLTKEVYSLLPMHEIKQREDSEAHGVLRGTTGEHSLFSVSIGDWFQILCG